MSAGRSLRVGLIGVGAVGAVHLEAYTQAVGVKVVAAADIDAARLTMLAARYGFEPYPDHRQMLAVAALDIACVLSPASLHAAMVADCAAAGVPVLTEKPIAPSVAEAEAMVAVCREAGVPLFYGSSYRYLPAVRAARDMIRADAIGDIVLIRESAVGGSGPANQLPYGAVHYPAGGPGGTGMGLVDHGVHLIDIFAWLINSPIVSAFGRGNVSGGVLRTEYALLEFSSGAVGQLLYDDGTWPSQLPAQGLFSAGSGWTHSGLSSPGLWEAEPGFIEVHGTKGALRVYHYANALYLRNREGLRQLPLPDYAAPRHFTRQIEAFASNLALGEEPETPAEAGVQAVRVIEAIYRSARERRVIDL
jgi:predicted dehydrogenase